MFTPERKRRLRSDVTNGGPTSIGWPRRASHCVQGAVDGKSPRFGCGEHLSAGRQSKRPANRPAKLLVSRQDLQKGPQYSSFASKVLCMPTFEPSWPACSWTDHASMPLESSPLR